MAKTKKLPANYMDIVFVRRENCPWRLQENGIVEVDMENRGFFNAVAQKFFKRPRVSHISLDKYGSTLWLALDGNSTVNDVLKKMNETFPDEKEKMLNRVVQFLATLEMHKFIVRK
ncbi:MAG: PqqD family protein [Treponema sp.]|nr:PqqD family protein [Treponema sp.]MBR0100710.1 PqqD family protein [Treponema sp.]